MIILSFIRIVKSQLLKPSRTGLKEPMLDCFLIQHRLFYGGATPNDLTRYLFFPLILHSPARSDGVARIGSQFW